MLIIITVRLTAPPARAFDYPEMIAQITKKGKRTP